MRDLFRHVLHAQTTQNLPVLPIAVAESGCQWRRAAEESLTKTGRPYRVAYISPNRSALDAAVMQGLALAAMPELCVRPGMQILTEAEGFPAFHKFNIGLISKQGQATQSALALANHIRDSFAVRGTRMAAE